MKLCVAIAVLALAAGPARADDEDFGGATVVFARGTSLYRVDARGKGETEVAAIATPGQKVAVRALRTDAEGRVLLVDLAGKWSWLPLDGSTRTLAALPCGDGPAQLSEDGEAVLCRGAKSGSQVITLKDGKSRALDVPTGRLFGAGAERRVVWADKSGVWTALVRDPSKKQQVAAEAPLRSFLASPDGQRALGVYADKIYVNAKDTKPGEVLMSFALDGQAARRKVIKNGVPIEWSHDSKWVLVQDGGSACLMMAGGGQYKCWRGYTGASIARDGRWGLVFGNRDGSKQQQKPKPQKPQKGKKPPKLPDSNPTPTEPTDEPESAGDRDAATDDVEVAPPSGPLALYRTRLEGAFTESPALIVKVVDGAAVWVPAPARPDL